MGFLPFKDTLAGICRAHAHFSKIFEAHREAWHSCSSGLGRYRYVVNTVWGVKHPAELSERMAKWLSRVRLLNSINFSQMPATDQRYWTTVFKRVRSIESLEYCPIGLKSQFLNRITSLQSIVQPGLFALLPAQLIHLDLSFTRNGIGESKGPISIFGI